MAYRVVCITRTTAAGGEAIGHAVAEQLGFRYVDDEIISRAAEAAGIEPAVVEAVEHQPGLLARLMDALVGRPPDVKGHPRRSSDDYSAEDVSPSRTPPPKEELRRLIQSAIVEIGKRGQAVIVAHAASFALAEKLDVLRVQVTASVDVRVRRLWENKLVSETDAAKAIADSDRGRQRYLARFYEVREEVPTHYDLVVNTDRLGLKKAAAVIVAAATA